MKYLKPYILFESLYEEDDNNIIYTLEDISLELKDDGFFVGMSNFKARPWEKGMYVLEVRIHQKPSGNFYLKDVYHSVRRMVDYMKDEGYGCSIFVGRGPNYWSGISLPENDKTLSTNLDSNNEYDYLNLKFSWKG